MNPGDYTEPLLAFQLIDRVRKLRTSIDFELGSDQPLTPAQRAYLALRYHELASAHDELGRLAITDDARTAHVAGRTGAISVRTLYLDTNALMDHLARNPRPTTAPNR